MLSGLLLNLGFVLLDLFLMLLDFLLQSLFLGFLELLKLTDRYEALLRLFGEKGLALLKDGFGLIRDIGLLL